VLRGGFLESIARPTESRRDAFFSAYVAAVLQRDVRDLAGIDDVGQLARLLALLAARTGSTANYTDLARSLGAPVTTVRRYIGLLEATFLVQRLSAWSNNANARVIKSPKLYLSDSGLYAHQAGVTASRIATDPSLLGPLLETFVVTELRKMLVWDAPRVTLLHFRTQGTHEVDIVLEMPDGRLVGIEVKASATLTGREFSGLRSLAQIAGHKFFRGVVLYTGQEALSFGDSFYALPIPMLWMVT
jgi:predicted AAA+ superfamily ATPase